MNGEGGTRKVEGGRLKDAERSVQMKHEARWMKDEG